MIWHFQVDDGDDRINILTIVKGAAVKLYNFYKTLTSSIT